MPKEIPILFSTDMVRAILAGNKTQTRRVVKPQLSRGLYQKSPNNWHTTEEDGIAHGPVHCPYGKVGDVLWVRESFVFRDKHNKYYFKADHANAEPYAHSGWKPSIHMPKAAARIWLQVTDIRVERLQDITQEDCLKEGIKEFEDGTFKNYFNKRGLRAQDGVECLLPKGSFQSLWSSINGPESWQSNPWVWVVSFKVLSTSGKPELTQEVITERAMDDDIHD